MNQHLTHCKLLLFSVTLVVEKDISALLKHSSFTS